MDQDSSTITTSFANNSAFQASANHQMNDLLSGNVPLLPASSNHAHSPSLSPESQVQQTTTTNKRKASDVKPNRRKQNKMSGTTPASSNGGVGTPGSSTLSMRQSSGHRPVTSCTHCRQHKIKCNASEKFPKPCSRCDRMSLSCEIDPQFRPKKGSQIQCLKNDVDELRSKIEFLTRNEHLLVQALQQQGGTVPSNVSLSDASPRVDTTPMTLKSRTESPPLVAKTFLKKEPNLLHDSRVLQRTHSSSAATPELLNDSLVNGAELPPIYEQSTSMKRGNSDSPSLFKNYYDNYSPKNFINSPSATNNITITNNTNLNKHHSTTSQLSLSQSYKNSPLSSTANITEFILGRVKLPIDKATELHKRYVEDYLPFLPIMSTDNPIELYQQSQLLFWVVMLTACLSEPEPTLYMSLASLIKQLAIETCWIRTPRSTHIIQALLILSNWPLPNQKVLDDCSYRFTGLAKSLSLQLGLHRGKFISEFSRTQVALPNAEKWRTRTWLAVFLAEQFWSSTLGLPPSMNTDYLLESARVDNTLPKNFRCLISLSIFQSKLVNTMGSSVSTPDGLMDPKNRVALLSILERELERLNFKLQIDDVTVEMYYLYVKLMICCFAFLPGTPMEDQILYIVNAYTALTRIVTIISKLIETRQLIEYPIWVRQSVTYAVLVLFRLHLSPYLLPKYVDSARQSIVTAHRLFRNMLSSWKDVENDISRIATVLEKLNFVIITHPELFTKNDGIIVRMRSHLTGSLFYDLVWCIHEARRRVLLNEKSGTGASTVLSNEDKPLPLPFYNQITKDDFKTITTTTPNGTTVTTLVPTDRAMNTATLNATLNGLSGPTEINGIPLSMLEATGSVRRGNNNNEIVETIPEQDQQLPFTDEQQKLQQIPLSEQVLNRNNSPILSENLSQFLNNEPISNGNTNNKLKNSDQLFIDTIFQQQGANWMEGGDDFLGWFDMNMAPEF